MGCGGHRPAVGDREVQRQVMALDPPAPGGVGPGCAEEREEVELRIAVEPPAVFELPQHALELHHRRGRQVAALTEAGAEQVVRPHALLFGHVADGQPVAGEHLGGDEVEPLPFVGRQLERRLGTLGRRQAVEKPVCGRGHVRRGPLGGDHGAGDRQQ